MTHRPVIRIRPSRASCRFVVILLAGLFSFVGLALACATAQAATSSCYYRLESSIDYTKDVVTGTISKRQDGTWRITDASGKEVGSGPGATRAEGENAVLTVHLAGCRGTKTAVEFNWLAPTLTQGGEPVVLGGYRLVGVGPNGQTYSAKLGRVRSHIAYLQVSGRWSFSLSAIDSKGLESLLSAPVVLELP